MKNQILEFYKEYPEKPFISEKRDYKKFLEEVKISKSKLVPIKNMNRTDEGLLPGDIILLWRINFGTFTTESIKEGMYPKYFEYTYGIDAPKSLERLISLDLVLKNSNLESLPHNNLTFLKQLLKNKNVKGLSKMKKEDVYNYININFNEKELEQFNFIKGYSLTPNGLEVLNNNNSIVDKHPKKKF